MKKSLRNLLFVALGAAFYHVTMADAAELRLIDSGGLVRAVKVVRGNARVVVSLSSPSGSLSGECTAVNVDGLAPEKRVPISAKGECIFLDVPVGSWQIGVPEGAQWRAQIYE